MSLRTKASVFTVYHSINVIKVVGREVERERERERERETYVQTLSFCLYFACTCIGPQGDSIYGAQCHSW